jgi:hypothetical protein
MAGEITPVCEIEYKFKPLSATHTLSSLSIAMLLGLARLAVAAVPEGAVDPHVPVPAKVLRTPAALILRIRQAPDSPM